MAKTDPWNSTDQQAQETLDVMVTRLESRGQNQMFVDMLDDYLNAMQIDGAATVLDMGCGTGLAARQICQRPGFSGRVTGIDLSDYLVAQAARLAEADGVGDRIDFLAGDTHSLKLDDGAFDAVVAHTLFSHVDHPAAVLGEAARVAKPGGLIGVFDGDYASLTFEQADEAASKTDDEKFINAVVAQPRVMRQMPRLAKGQGLELVQVFSYVLTETGEADFWVSAIQGFRNLGPSSGLMTAEEANGWADRQMAASEDGVFFGSSNYYGYVLRKPS